MVPRTDHRPRTIHCPLCIVFVFSNLYLYGYGYPSLARSKLEEDSQPVLFFLSFFVEYMFVVLYDHCSPVDWLTGDWLTGDC